VAENRRKKEAAQQKADRDAALVQQVLHESIDKKKAKLSKLLNMMEKKEEKISQLAREVQELENKVGEGDKDLLAPHLPHIRLTSRTSQHRVGTTPSCEVTRPNISPDARPRPILSNIIHKASLSKCRLELTCRFLLWQGVNSVSSPPSRLTCFASILTITLLHLLRFLSKIAHLKAFIQGFQNMYKDRGVKIGPEPAYRKMKAWSKILFSATFPALRAITARHFARNCRNNSRRSRGLELIIF
jgi:hypothetical protein